MGAGIVLLVAIGFQDLFITNDPQVTFFKVMYRRHTNFAIEPLSQYFNTTKVEFGQKISCTLSRVGDLVNKIYFVMDVPAIPINFVDTKFRYAWVKRIGYAILKSIEIDIGGQSIDKQFGDWLNIWSEVSQTNRIKLDEQIGNVKELYDFTNGKSSYRIHVPLEFWFCQKIGSSLPIVALQYNEIKINFELENLDNVRLIGPTHTIDMNTTVTHYTEGEIIKQEINGSPIAMGIFLDYDVALGRLYYIKTTDTAFKGFDSSTVQFNTNSSGIQTFINSFAIVGMMSNYRANPLDNAVETKYKLSINKLIQKMIIPKCFLIVDYIYLAAEERTRFLYQAHEYLIEQLQLGSFKIFQQKNFQVNLQLNNPIKALYWIAQMNICATFKDTFNYTNSPLRDKNNKLLGKNLVRKSSISLNSVPRFIEQTADYFNYIQPLFYYPRGPEEGINCYSFGVHPTEFQPGGSCNMSKIDLISLFLSIDPLAFTGGSSSIKVYGHTYNIFRIINGLGGLLFTN
jgi:hypothetical protein